MSRIRTNLITNRMANGAPTVSNGLVISGVTTSTNVSVASSVTATTFYGSGANLTGITQTTINNNATTKFITGSGSANTLDCEANLSYNNSLVTFSSSSLMVDKGTNPTISTKETSGNKEVQLRSNTTGGLLRTVGSYPLVLGTNQTERLRIDSNGKVTVAAGTVHASRVLARFGIDCHGMNIYDGVGVVANYGMAFYNDPTTDKANGIGFFNDDGQTCGGYIVHQDKGGSNVGDLIFATSATANTPVERLRITSAGNILIGNNNGGSEVINMVGGGGGILISRSASGSPNDGQTLGDIGLNSYSSSQSCSSADVLIRGQADGNHSGSSAGSALLLFTKPASTGPGSAPTERMRINKDGQVTKSSQPSFAAYRNQDGYGLNNQIFPFNTVRYNIGGHFNTGNHRFTAPVAGRYLFNFYSIYNTSGSSHQIQYRVNNSTSQGMQIHFSHAGGWDYVL